MPVSVGQVLSEVCTVHCAETAAATRVGPLRRIRPAVRAESYVMVARRT